VGCGSGILVLFGNVRSGFPSAQDIRVCANTVCTIYPAGPVRKLCGPETETGKLTCEYVRATRSNRTARRLIAITLRSGWLEHTTKMPLTITVLGARGLTLFSAHTVVKLTKFAPNGVKCGPVCFTGQAVFAPRLKRFIDLDSRSAPKLAHKLEEEAFPDGHDDHRVTLNTFV